MGEKIYLLRLEIERHGSNREKCRNLKCQHASLRARESPTETAFSKADSASAACCHSRWQSTVADITFPVSRCVVVACLQTPIAYK